MQHFFDIDIAKEYGLQEAIILNNLNFWILKNEANNKHFYDGNYWTYNSMKAFHQLFPYLTERKISYCLKKLEEKNLIKTGNYNKIAYDRTLWYAITDFGKSILQNSKMEKLNLSNGNVNFVNPIPDNKTQIINTDNKTQIIKQKNINKKSLINFNLLIDSFTKNEKLKNAINDFIEMRVNKKAPLTERAFQLILRELTKLSDCEQVQIEILNNSIMKNYTGVFDISEEKKKEILAKESQRRLEEAIVVPEMTPKEYIKWEAEMLKNLNK